MQESPVQLFCSLKVENMIWIQLEFQYEQKVWLKVDGEIEIKYIFGWGWSL